MPPNSMDPTMAPEIVTVTQSVKNVDQTAVPRETNYNLYIFQSTLNLLAHVLIGVVVGICLLFSLRGGLPLGATFIHIILCVIGYQLLMGQAILSLTQENGWSAKLRLVDKRRAHWILQIMGSALALAGSFVIILEKNVHWNTNHGRFALVALVFTVASLVNGLTSLYAYEFRRIFNGNISKLTHVCFGIVTFTTASIALCYGFDYNFFRNWASDEFSNALIAFTAAFTTIIIINPFITFCTKASNAIRK
ncbi:unnamed protein product [Parnassius mnemosyne]|uniref:ascorbate ferrireductase (transmembrane) n=1 Tax=Parnassius mnemosyne TaxID=213953 RepID=A0AAV1KM31_9NEOP